MAAELTDCPHREELREMWEGWVPLPDTPWCCTLDPHPPHDDCLGIFCDFGCNAEDF